ncbi:unnamed protein product [Calicophoron daubneyi]|uniref:CCR4-NOT transcription complex subunit 1 n=1 Tax=Calicophoron daubneyi TaxID=300641 RepID=A0AAV2TID5_CALDB
MKPVGSGIGSSLSGSQSQQTRGAVSSGLPSGSNIHQYQPPNLSTVAALAAVNSFSSNADDLFSRSSNTNSLASRMNQLNLAQHSRKPQQLGTSDGLHGSFGNPLDHQPVALSFANEPIEIEMTKEAEAEANTFFQKLLKGISTPDEMFKIVCEYATQNSLAQRKLLDGILRMLADEVSRYLQDYPEPMLPLIADLYGSILAASTHLLSIRQLSMLWRALLARLYVMPPDTTLETPLFRAVILILLKAKNTFTQFFNLPNCLVSCPVFKLFPHDLQEYLLNAEILAKNYVLAQQPTSSGFKANAGGGFHQTGHMFGQHQNFSSAGGGSSSQVAASLSLTAQPPPPQTELNTKPPDPPEEAISDRIYFLFNNVSKTNEKEKSDELASILSEERLLPWFAFYLVGKRIPVEHSFHELFASVLDHVQERVPNLRPKVMQELLRNIKLILRNMRLDRDDMQVRVALKNYGNFLGLITLARNKPLLYDDLNVKDLIYEAYHKGPIPTQYVVPFVARIVRCANESLVFRPPNPWTMAILKVLRELYDMRDVKDCLRFEIEILYRTFQLSLDDVPMANFLRDPSYFTNLEVQLCFLVTGTPTTSSSALDNTSAAISGVDSSTTTAIATTAASDLVPVTVASSLPSQQQQQQMLSMLAALQKPQHSIGAHASQQAQTANNTTGVIEMASTITTTSVPQSSVYSSAEFTNMMQSPLVTGSAPAGAGPRQQTSQALALAALAASQSQKQQQQFGNASAAGNTGSMAPLGFSIQQKQLAAAVAALQQQLSQLQPQQQQQTTLLANSAPSTQYQNVTSSHDAANDTLCSHLRYEDVSIRTIRACLNLDDLVGAAAASSRVNVSGSNNTASAAITLLQTHPRLRSLIEPAIIRAISELTTPVFERCARITVATVAAIVRKDFALDPDPNRMLYAARQMVRHLAAGMSLITAREALGMSLVTGLKNIMLGEVQSASGLEKEAVQRLAHLIVAKSMHACLAFMQKSVAEKAVNDVEKKLETDLKLRAELGPRRFLEQATNQLAAQQANMPESLRLVVGGPTPSEMAVYEEFGRLIPGFAQSPAAPSNAFNTSLGLNASSLGQVTSPGAVNAAAMNAAMAAYLQFSNTQQQQDASAVGRAQRQVPAGGANVNVSLVKPLMGQTHLNQASAQQQTLVMQQQHLQQAPITGLFDKIIGQIERHLTAISSRLHSTTDPMIRSLRCLVDAVHLAKNSRDTSVPVTVIATMVQSFLEHYRPSCWREQPRGLETMEHFKEAHMLTLRHMLSSDQAPFGYAWVTRQVTQTWIQMDGGSATNDKRSSSTTAAGATDTTSNDNRQRPSEDNVNEEKPMGDSETGGSAWSGWNSAQTDTTRSEGGTVDYRMTSIKWNWEAFAELLKVHVVYLSQVDSYLAQEVASGHPGAITFVIDLLDHFVLPCPSGTAVGAAAAAAANYARSSATTAGHVAQTASSVANPSSASATYSGSSTASGGPASSNQSKREFTVLNEYDLWSTLEAMRARVGCLNAMLSASPNPASLTDPLALRLRLACARIRGLLDLGLLEQSPLFTNQLSASAPIGALYAGCSQAREFDDPPNLQEKVELLMRNWVEIYQSPRQRDPATIEAMLSQLAQIGVLPNMDSLTRFLRLATIFVVERALKQLKLQEQQQSQQQTFNFQMPVGASGTMPLPSFGGASMSPSMSVARVSAYVELDAYARLISILIKRSGDASDQSTTKVTLLNKVLGIITGTLLQEHEVRRDWFHPMPFERILIMLFVELHSPASTYTQLSSPNLATPSNSLSVETGTDGKPSSETVTDNASKEVSPSAAPDKATNPPGIANKGIEASVGGVFGKGGCSLTLQQQLPLVFCHLLHCLRPERATAFVFSWLEMLAHRWFVGRILAAPGPPELRAAYQAMYAQLLVDLLKFLGYFLQNALMPKPIQCLYKATLRLFLVLIHDFPEFVSDYYALFCDVVPSNSIQMRNLILSALPKRGIPSADPLQAPPVDHLASLEDPTGYCMEAGSRLPDPMRRELDAYLATRAPVKLLSELVTMLRRADDILPPLPPPQFAYHPQQQARHQQALAAYAAALAANDTGSTITLPVSAPKTEEKSASDDTSAPAGPNHAAKKTATSKGSGGIWDVGENVSGVSPETNTSETAGSAVRSVVGSSSAAAALLWGVRATQQLATFGLADGMHYNVELMTNLTLYVCITAIRSLREKGMPLNMSTIAHTPQMDIIQSLVLNLDNEGRYLLLNCMANQLRYPNSHTYYFSYTILYLFSEQSKEQVKEQISRVLMERLIVNRPHPWGLLMTSAELLRNPTYRFWEHEFARCNPEIETIVTIVARSCIPNFQIPTIASSSGQANASGLVSGLRNALPPSATPGRRQGSPLARGNPNVSGVHPSAISAAPAPLLTE